MSGELEVARSVTIEDLPSSSDRGVFRLPPGAFAAQPWPVRVLVDRPRPAKRAELELRLADAGNYYEGAEPEAAAAYAPALDKLVFAGADLEVRQVSIARGSAWAERAAASDLTVAVTAGRGHMHIEGGATRVLQRGGLIVLRRGATFRAHAAPDAADPVELFVTAPTRGQQQRAP